MGTKPASLLSHWPCTFEGSPLSGVFRDEIHSCLRPWLVQQQAGHRIRKALPCEDLPMTTNFKVDEGQRPFVARTEGRGLPSRGRGKSTTETPTVRTQSGISPQEARRGPLQSNRLDWEKWLVGQQETLGGGLRSWHSFPLHQSTRP